MMFFKRVGKKFDPFSTQKQFKSYFIKQTVAQVTRTHIVVCLFDTMGRNINMEQISKLFTQISRFKSGNFVHVLPTFSHNNRDGTYTEIGL